jgi:hypothetical protein
MSESRNERLIENNKILVISDATMSKDIPELETEEAELLKDIKNTEELLKDASSNKVVDFAQFKSINKQLHGKQDLLEEVHIALQIKRGEGIHDFVEVKEKKRA